MGERLRWLIGGWLLLIALMLTLNGCVTRAAAKAQAREAFVAGQQQALARMPQQSQQMQGPSVTVVGPVKNGVIPWTEDLTLAKAIIAAGYAGTTDPREIHVVRGGRAMQIDPKALLSGEDMAMQPGDILQLTP